MVKKGFIITADSPSNRRYTAGIVFIIILAVYLVTLLLLFPNLPIIAHHAEDIPGYDRTYPPFRVDEYNYHTIAENLLQGHLYRGGGT